MHGTRGQLRGHVSALLALALVGCTTGAGNNGAQTTGEAGHGGSASDAPLMQPASATGAAADGSAGGAANAAQAVDTGAGGADSQAAVPNAGAAADEGNAKAANGKQTNGAASADLGAAGDSVDEAGNSAVGSGESSMAGAGGDPTGSAGSDATDSDPFADPATPPDPAMCADAFCFDIFDCYIFNLDKIDCGFTECDGFVCK